MRKIQLLAAIVAIVSLTACSTDEQPTNSNEGKNIQVRISGINDSNTRFAGPEEIVTSATQDIDDAGIYLADASDNVSDFEVISKTGDATRWAALINTATDGGIKMINIQKNTSKVYVFANTSLSNLGTSTNKVLDLATTLPVQSDNGHVLYMGVDETITPPVAEPIKPDETEGSTYVAEVSIKPIVARMQIKSITFQETGNITITKTINGSPESTVVTWSGFAGSVKGIYLNNFYYDYTFADNAKTLMHNTFYDGTITNGTWMFNGTDAASYAAYVNYTGGAFQDLPLTPTNACYGFNFFPGAEFPTIHLDIVTASGLVINSTEHAVFNPGLGDLRFANITQYFKTGNTPMVASDFVAGHIYNMDVVITPILDTDISSVQYNVLVTVTVEPWVEETITPGFEYQN